MLAWFSLPLTVRGESKDADVEIEMSLEPPALLELRQCHDYIRHVTGLYIAWFTFFLTTVLAAIAWSFVSSLAKMLASKRRSRARVVPL